MSTPQKRLFLLDAFALIFRGYYAFIKNPRINSQGMDTSAIMGFMNSLLDVIKREKPDHLAVCFDKGGSVIRSEMFPNYKANRQETPDAIKIAVPYIQQILEAMHIPVIEKSGFEADDLIGTLSKQAEQAGYQVYMVTPDKDFAQLVSENIFMYRPARMGNGIEILGVEEVKAKFEVEDPIQVIDYLGMMGDAVDNIPGLPGVGSKTAVKFLKLYGSMEGLFENIHELKGKMKEKVAANQELGLLSKKLATILLDCPVQFEEKDYELTSPDSVQVEALFNELEFRRMLTQFEQIFKHRNEKGIEVVGVGSSKQIVKNEEQFSLFGGDDTSQEVAAGAKFYKDIEDADHHYQIVDSELGIRLLVQKLMLQKSVCFDVQTIGDDVATSELIGVAFSYESGKGYYVSFPEDSEGIASMIKRLQPFFESESIQKVGHNIKYGIKILANYGVLVQGVLFDTMIAHYLINPDMRHTIDILSETYLKYSPKSIVDLIGKKGKKQKSKRDISVEFVKEYAAEYADIVWRLKEVFENKVDDTGVRKVLEEIELPLIQVLSAMELEGIRLDKQFLTDLSQDLATDIKQLEGAIFEVAGEVFNLASPKQLGDVLFEKLKLGGAKPKKTKTGQYATGEEILSNLAKDHQVVQSILDWRSLVKLQNTYVDALPEQVNVKTGRVHTDYMQAVAATGRLSSNNPNLQNIPIRTERGRQIRKAFVPKDKDYVLFAADYSQIELRIIAALSEDPEMISSFSKGEDIHASTAAKVFNVALDEVTREQRSHAKTVNFGIIYGVSAFGLSNQTNLTRGESKDLINAYYETYPRLKDYIGEQVEFARENGYVETILGRKRYLKDINSPNAIVRGGAERNAVNAPIQGSAADVIKIAMINIYEKLRSESWKSKMLLQVHDELVFDAHVTELDALKEMVKDQMENAFQLGVPLVVDMGVGQDWLEAH